MTQIGADHPLVARISAMRSRVRLLLGLYGVGVTLVALLATALVLVFADYLIHLPATVRLVVLLAVAAGAAAWAYRKLVMPLTTRLTDQFLASRVENVEKNLADELISAVHFIRSGLREKNILAAKAIEAVESRAAGVRFEESLDFAGAVRALIAAGVLVALIAGLAAFQPGLARVGLTRWLNPFGHGAYSYWPRNTDVELVWPDGKPPTVHALGDRLTVRARVTRGGYENMRVWLYTSSDTQRETHDQMNYQVSQSDNAKGLYGYQKDVEPVGDHEYHLQVVAGDNNEASPETSVTIRLAPRPIVVGLAATVTPPAYVKNLVDPRQAVSSKAYNLLEQAGRAVQGSNVTLRVVSSKPLALNAGGAPDVVLMESGRDTPLNVPGKTARAVDDHTADVSFPAIEPMEFRVIVRDTDGFENRVAGTAKLDVVPDALPTVVITEPRRQVDAVADAVVRVQIQANDDWGLSELYLEAANMDAKAGEPPRFRKELTWAHQDVDAALQTVSARADYAWDLAGMSLKPGDRLSFYALVRDNYAMPWEAAAKYSADFEVMKGDLGAGSADVVRHRLVKSAMLTVQIWKPEDLVEKARLELQEIREQIRNLDTQQTTTNEQTRAVQKTAAAAGLTTPQQKTQLAEQASEENVEAQRARAIKDKLEQLAASLKANRLDTTEVGKTAQDAAQGMDEVGQKDMPAAASALSQAQDAAAKGTENDKPDTPKTQSQKDAEKQAARQTADSAGKAGENQEQAMRTMEGLLDKLASQNDFGAIRERVTKAIENQKASETTLRQIAQDTFGKKPEDLTPEQKAKLDKLATDESKQATETQALTEAAKKAAEQLQQKDPASAESLQKAAEKSEASNISQTQGSASKETGDNRISNAAGDMQRAQQGLEEMKDELDKQNQRQLEQLARELEQLLQALQKIRSDQAAVKDETTTAGPQAKAAVLRPLGDREDRLDGNTLAITSKVEANPKLRAVASDLKDAQAAMVDATAGLLKTKQPEALPAEEKALAALDKAIEKLAAEKKKVDDALMDEDLAAFRKKYEAIRDRQTVVMTATADVAKKVAAQAIARPEVELGKLSTTQGTLADDVGTLSKNDKLKAYEVIIWINGQIVDEMQNAQGRLAKAETGRQVALAQQTAIDRLTDIIDALKEEQRKKEFKDDDSGGGGGGGGQKPQLIPPLAQLKLLKSQQMVINRDTAGTNRDLETAKTDDEKSDLKAQAAKLGATQDKVRDMASQIIDGLKQ